MAGCPAWPELQAGWLLGQQLDGEGTDLPTDNPGSCPVPPSISLTPPKQRCGQPFSGHSAHWALSVPMSCSWIMCRYNIDFRGLRWTPDPTPPGTHLNFPCFLCCARVWGLLCAPDVIPSPDPGLLTSGPQGQPTPDCSLFSHWRL